MNQDIRAYAKQKNVKHWQIADALGMTTSAISHQLRTLKQSRLVKFRREGKTIFYALDDDHIFSILRQGMEHIQE